MNASQQAIIIGRGLNSRWAFSAPLPGTKVQAVVVEMEGGRGIMDVDGSLVRIETQLPLQEGQSMALLFLGRQAGQARFQLLLPEGTAGQAATQSQTPSQAPDGPLPGGAVPSVQRAVIQGLVAAKLPVTKESVAAVQAVLPDSKAPQFYPRLAAALRLLQADLPVSEAAVRALLQSDQLQTQIPKRPAEAGTAEGEGSPRTHRAPAPAGGSMPGTDSREVTSGSRRQTSSGPAGPPVPRGQDAAMAALRGQASAARGDRAPGPSMRPLLHIPGVVLSHSSPIPDGANPMLFLAAGVQPAQAEAVVHWFSQPAVPMLFGGISQVLMDPWPPAAARLFPQLFSGPFDTGALDITASGGRGELTETRAADTGRGTRTPLDPAARVLHAGEGGAERAPSRAAPHRAGPQMPRPDTETPFHQPAAARVSRTGSFTGRVLQVFRALGAEGTSPGPGDGAAGQAAPYPPRAAAPSAGAGSSSEQLVQDAARLFPALPAAVDAAQPLAGLEHFLSGRSAISIFELLARGFQHRESDGATQSPARETGEAAGRLASQIGAERLSVLAAERTLPDPVCQWTLPLHADGRMSTLHLRLQREAERQKGHAAERQSAASAELLTDFGGHWLWVHLQLQSDTVRCTIVAEEERTARLLGEQRPLLETFLQRQNLALGELKAHRGNPLERWQERQPLRDQADALRRTAVRSLDLKA